MTVTAQTTDVSPGDPVFLCTVPGGGVLVKNLGDSRVFLGGPGVVASEGYPLDPGESQVFTGTAAHESPVVPSPPQDLTPSQLYGCVADGSAAARISWISA